MIDHNSPEDSGQDARSPLAIGYMWATVIMTMGIESVLPILLGVFLDYKLGTVCLFLILGIFLGLFIMVVNFIKLMKSKEFQPKVNPKKHKHKQQDKAGK